MYGKATFIKVNQLRYGSLSQKYQVTSVQVLIAFNGIVYLLVEYHLKHILKEPTIRISYQYPNVTSHEWQNWKVDNGSSILSGLVVKLYNNIRKCVQKVIDNICNISAWAW